MKRYSQTLLASLALVAAGAAAAGDSSTFKPGDGVLLAQSGAPLTLTCAVRPANGQSQFTQNYCSAPYAASNYTVTFLISGGSSNQAYSWTTRTPNTCSSTTAACNFSTTANRRDVEGDTFVTVTDLNTGAVTSLSIGYAVPATCFYGGSFGYVFC